MNKSRKARKCLVGKLREKLKVVYYVQYIIKRLWLKISTRLLDKTLHNSNIFSTKPICCHLILHVIFHLQIKQKSLDESKHQIIIFYRKEKEKERRPSVWWKTTKRQRSFLCNTNKRNRYGLFERLGWVTIFSHSPAQITSGGKCLYIISSTKEVNCPLIKLARP